MKPTDYKSRAFLSIVSHKLSPNEIGDRLGIKYDDAIWKGAPNPFGKPQLHPFNLIIFRSRLSVSLSMDQHADDILSRLFPIWSKVKRLPKSCKASLTFCYHMRRSGGALIPRLWPHLQSWMCLAYLLWTWQRKVGGNECSYSFEVTILPLKMGKW